MVQVPVALRSTLYQATINEALARGASVAMSQAARSRVMHGANVTLTVIGLSMRQKVASLVVAQPGMTEIKE